MKLKNKNISVIGLGNTGIAAANFLSKRGARVTVTDNKSEEQLSDSFKNLCLIAPTGSGKTTR